MQENEKRYIDLNEMLIKQKNNLKSFIWKHIERNIYEKKLILFRYFKMK